jgi:CMP-2-keto-3-deoxyoctulosonic acid synthetase
MILSAALLAKYGNIRKDICYPIQRLNQVRMLSNGENIGVIPTEKKLQIIAQNSNYYAMLK